MNKPTVLVVEDDSPTQTLLGLLLGYGGYEVVLANDGRMALEVLEALEVDLILTDLMMPVLDGVGLIKELKQRKEFAALPVLVLTAGSEELQARAIQAGAAAILLKPKDVPGVAETITPHLRQAAAVA